MDDVVILSAVRTPIGAFQGALCRPSRACPRSARALAAAIERAGLTPEEIQQVNMGCVLAAGQGQAPARQAALGAGCPVVDRRAHPEQGLRLRHAGGDDRRQRPALRRLRDAWSPAAWRA